MDEPRRADGPEDAERTPYSREAVGLLDRIADRALDDDYYVVREGRYSRSRQFNTLATAAMLAIFALMVTITGIQNYRDRPASELTRATLVADIEARQAQLADRESRARDLRDDVDALQAADVGSPDSRRVRVLSGDAPVRGGGLVVRVDPGDTLNGSQITDTELRGLVNALWFSGAEAVALNGQRIGALTSIRSAGEGLAVNFRSIGPPFTIEAIGDTGVLEERFVATGEPLYWERRRSGLVDFSVVTTDALVLEGAPIHRTSVNHALAAGGSS